jgi:hypothetical protein
LLHSKRNNKVEVLVGIAVDRFDHSQGTKEHFLAIVFYTVVRKTIKLILIYSEILNLIGYLSAREGQTDHSRRENG